MIEHLVALALQTNYDQCTPQELTTHFLKVMDEGNYLLLLTPDKTQIAAYLEYEWDGCQRLHIHDLLCPEPGAIWHLWAKLKLLPWTHLHFKRQKTGKWKTYRRAYVTA